VSSYSFISNVDCAHCRFITNPIEKAFMKFPQWMLALESKLNKPFANDRNKINCWFELAYRKPFRFSFSSILKLVLIKLQLPLLTITVVLLSLAPVTSPYLYRGINLCVVIFPLYKLNYNTMKTPPTNFTHAIMLFCSVKSPPVASYRIIIY